VKGWTPFSVVIAMLILAALAAPATAAASAADLPTDLWNPLPPDPTAPDESSGNALLVVLSALAIASVAGFLIGELLPGRARARPEGPRIARSVLTSGPRLERCAIVIARSGTRADFRVVAVRGAGRGLIGRSPPFDVPRSGPIPNDGPARAAYDVLLAQLQANGWRLVAAEPSAWYRAQFVRARPANERELLPA
jgi:hypothetical protein